MKQNVMVLILALLSVPIHAQLGESNINKTVKLEELEVPNSPAFIIADLSPSLIENPTTPKKFILGVAQSYQASENGFPQNYSAEFTPYWWLKPSGKNVYSLFGLSTRKDESGNIREVTGENPFSGLKFTSLSIAFLNKDLIPDSLTQSQKVVSLGVRTTLVKIHPKRYYTGLANKIAEWHETALAELSNSPLQAQLSRETDTAKQRKMLENSLLTPSSTSEIVEEINDILLQKPLFSWDVAGAFATYGIGDTVWSKGRSGIWTTLSSFLPLAIGEEEAVNRNYLSLNFAARFLGDNYYKDDKGAIVKHNLVDIGGKIGLEFKAFSIGYEYFKRSGSNIAGQKRSVGIINYQVGRNFYINGAFGENFNLPNKLVAVFGIRWGIRTETVNLSNATD